MNFSIFFSLSFSNFHTSKLFVLAAHPIIGGMAPTTLPTQVLLQCICLRGVYTAAYSPMFPTARPAESLHEVNETMGREREREK